MTVAIPVGQNAVDVEAEGLHVEDALGRLSPQLSGHGLAASDDLQRRTLGRIPLHILGQQRGQLVSISGRQGFVIACDQGARLFGLHRRVLLCAHL